MAKAKDGFSNILLGVGSFFFFLGFVVFEGLRIEVENNMINPFVVTGFAFVFGSFLWRFRRSIVTFSRTI